MEVTKYPTRQINNWIGTHDYMWPIVLGVVAIPQGNPQGTKKKKKKMMNTK